MLGAMKMCCCRMEVPGALPACIREWLMGGVPTAG